MALPRRAQGTRRGRCNLCCGGANTLGVAGDAGALGQVLAYEAFDLLGARLWIRKGVIGGIAIEGGQQEAGEQAAGDFGRAGLEGGGADGQLAQAIFGKAGVAALVDGAEADWAIPVMGQLGGVAGIENVFLACLLYTSPSPRD